MSKLVIVESPTKARTISKMLGKDYEVQASMGHVRDLPERSLGIDIAHDFAPQYESTSRSEGVVKRLRAAAKKADEIYLAPDPDREGEAIAWHLREVLKGNTRAPFHRVTFHEITRNAIAEAMKNPGEIDLNLVDAQQARRVLDRIVGYQVSPILWRNLEKGSSAGRVQSVALRLVVERERQILNFIPEEYWEFFGKFAGNGTFSAKLNRIDGKDFRVTSQAEAEKVESAIREGGTPRVAAVTRQQRKRTAPPPFTTSSLQQVANTLLHFSASVTMSCAQQLYEGIDIGSGTVGLITYMRTDSVNIALEAKRAAAAFIAANYGEDYVPEKFNAYRSKAMAQEAHEAIRPTDVNRTPESLKDYLTASQFKLYSLIWKRFVASQMTPAVYDQTSVDVDVVGADSRAYRFRTTASVLKFPGFSKVYHDNANEDATLENEKILQGLKEGDLLKLEDLQSEQKFTEPPARYTEATLVKALEDNGIGRPSTYASILRTIQDREYVSKQKNQLVPTEFGFNVSDFLTAKLPQLFDVGFTAKMEDNLDNIESGKESWVSMMRGFYDKFTPWLKAAKETAAAPNDKAKAAIALLDGVKFRPMHRIGKRNFNDGAFFRTICDKMESSGNISEKQYVGLLGLAGRYAEQIPNIRLNALDAEARKIFDDAYAEYVEQMNKIKDVPPATPEKYANAFAALKNVKFNPPITRGKVLYDDAKFVKSLASQAKTVALSERQIDALGKLLKKYSDQIDDVDKFLDEIGVKVGEPTLDDEKNYLLVAEKAIEQLSKVKEWAAPTSKGRYNFDDKMFFNSVARQFKSFRKLSPKQLAALKKLVVKYQGQIEQ